MAQLNSIANATNQVVGQQGQELNKVLQAMLADITAIRTALITINTSGTGTAGNNPPALTTSK